jgi:hypothetical protein
MARRRLPRRERRLGQVRRQQAGERRSLRHLAVIKECFPDGAALTTVKNDGSNMDLFYTVYKAGSQSVTTSNRLFGWEIRYDPAYATEAGGPCGTCTDPIYWTSVEARPGSFAGNPTTPLVTSTARRQQRQLRLLQLRLRGRSLRGSHVGQLKSSIDRDVTPLLKRTQEHIPALDLSNTNDGGCHDQGFRISRCSHDRRPAFAGPGIDLSANHILLL